MNENMIAITHYGDIPRVKVGDPTDFFQGKGYCIECGCPEGEYHYPRCDFERCGICGTQWITCEHGSSDPRPMVILLTDEEADFFRGHSE